MRNLIFLVIVASLFSFSCSSNKERNSSQVKSETKIKKKGKKMFGEITTYTPKPIDQVKSEELPVNSAELFFKSGDDYYLILTSKGGIDEEEQKTQINKELKIWGEIIELTDKEKVPEGSVVVRGMSGYIILYEVFLVK